MLPQNPLLLNLLSFTLKIVLGLLAIFVYTKLAGPIPFSVSSVNTNKTDAFSVTGVGKASIAPSQATLRAGVVANGPTAKAVQDQMNTMINKVSEAIKNAGIDPKDIQTENYNVNPNYDFSDGSQKIVGYAANTNLIIKIKDISKANQIIDLVTQNGANQVGGLTFDNEDNTKAQTEARQKAVEDAKKKADEAAKIAGFKLGKIINYSEGQGSEPPIIYARDAALPQGGGSAANVEPGTNEVVVNVTLSYEVR